MQPLVAEFLGTMILILLGGGVCANVNLRGTHGHNSGWIVVTAGWGLAVYIAVVCSQSASGAHLNPAVSIGFAAAGKFAWSKVWGYSLAQFLGAFVGAVLVTLFYWPHFAVTESRKAKLGTFCTAPAIEHLPSNLLGEVLGTFVLVLVALLAEGSDVGLGAVGALPVGLLVFAIGLGLGGTSGYAINPVRDFAPRLVHQLSPIPDKGDSQWHYAWIPIAGPLLGAFLAALVYGLVR